MRCFLVSAILVFASSAFAGPEFFPPVNGDDRAPVLHVYSSLDTPIAAPLIAGFQTTYPDVAVFYEELLTGEIYERVVGETDAGKPTADVAFSSAMDLQIKLANDGYARESNLPLSANWPRWANWRNTAYALTFEPAVFVYHKPSFQTAEPPATREQLVSYLRGKGQDIKGRIATYDIERSGVGFMLMARDKEQFADIWSVIRTMGAAGVQLFETSGNIVREIGDGRILLGYNILGSYAAKAAAHNPDVGILLPRDYTIVMSRIGLVPKAAKSPNIGAQFLEYLMSEEGQDLLARQLHIGAINPDVSGDNTAGRMQEVLGSQLRPVPVSPGLLVYLDQVKRRRVLQLWRDAVSDR